MTRRNQVLQALRDAGSNGLTVKEAFNLNIGTEMRRVCTDLIRSGYNITTKWEYSRGSRYKRYYLDYQKPVFTFLEVRSMPKETLPDDIQQLRKLWTKAKNRGDKVEMIRIELKVKGLQPNPLVEQVKKYLT